MAGRDSRRARGRRIGATRTRDRRRACTGRRSGRDGGRARIRAVQAPDQVAPRVRPRPTAPATTGASRPARIRYVILAEIALCALPALIAVKVGSFHTGAYLLFPAILVCLVLNALIAGPVANLSFILGIMPVVTLLRDLFLYNSVIVLLAIGIGGVIVQSKRQRRVLKSAGFVWVLYVALLYWLISFAITGDYSANLRILELVLGAAALLVLSRFPDFCATALFGLLLSSIAIGAALYGYGDRLGYVDLSNMRLGNPITFGEVLALLLLLVLADNGKWLLLQRNALVRAVLCLVVGVLLLLSTSRGSWLVAAAGICVILVLGRRNRAAVLGGLAVLAISLTIAMSSRRGMDFTQYVNDTFASDRSLSQRSDGRADQWMLLPMVMHDAPPWGFGPGSGRSVYAHYSLLDPRVRLDPGHQMAWHSLYLQVLVEGGVIGLGVLLAFQALLIRTDLRHWRRTGDIMPLVGTVGFMMIAMTVSGMDVYSGVFLGLGLATRDILPHRGRERHVSPLGDARMLEEPELAVP